jgi:hypothetical protein
MKPGSLVTIKEIYDITIEMTREDLPLYEKPESLSVIGSTHYKDISLVIEEVFNSCPKYPWSRVITSSGRSGWIEDIYLTCHL